MWPDTAFAATKHSLVFSAPVSLLLAVPILVGCTDPDLHLELPAMCLKGSCSPFSVLKRESCLNLSEDLSFEAFGSWAKPLSTTAVPWSFIWVVSVGALALSFMGCTSAMCFSLPSNYFPSKYFPSVLHLWFLFCFSSRFCRLEIHFRENCQATSFFFLMSNGVSWWLWS